jgi:carbonic anhydrase
MIPAQEALQRLRAGNARFVDNKTSRDSRITQAHREALADGQAPFAIVLGCSDSRVPAELVFDQRLGDLFVIRVAGNVVEPSLIGSVEYAAAHLGTRLVVVMGHSHCGAVGATLAELQKKTPDLSPGIRAIVDRIRPAFEGLSIDESDRDETIEQAVIANVLTSVSKLQDESTILRNLVENDGLKIVGAHCALHTGFVDFFHGIPFE